GLPRRPVSGHCREPIHHLLHGGDGKRQVRVRMDRRSRLSRNCLRLHHRRMKLVHAIATAVLMTAAVVPLLAAEIAEAQRRSGYSFMTPDTQAMQNDDTANPGMLWVMDGEALWNARDGAAGKACSDCHGDARASMKGVAARYPAFDQV